MVVRANGMTKLMAAVAIFAMAGCAHITFESADQWQKPWYERWFSKSDGIHYYRPKPYLLVTDTQKSGGKGDACSVEIKYLPDFDHEYIMIPHYWLGSVAMRPTLADGWNLTSFDSTVDTKLPETLNAMASMAHAAAPSGVAALVQPKGLAAEPSNINPGLYPLVPSAGGLAVDREHRVFSATGTVCSTVTAPEPKPKEPGKDG